MSEPICKNCLRFHNSNGMYGHCALPHVTNGFVAGSACGFRVGENFGCNQFKEKATKADLPDITLPIKKVNLDGRFT